MFVFYNECVTVNSCVFQTLSFDSFSFFESVTLLWISLLTRLAMSMEVLIALYGLIWFSHERPSLTLNRRDMILLFRNLHLFIPNRP